MKHVNIFDVLIVYTSNIATSASESTHSDRPFSKYAKYEIYNDVYAYFIQQCRRKNMSVAFSTSSDIIGPGKTNSYWEYKNKKWVAHQDQAYSQQIFEKFTLINKHQRFKHDLLFSSQNIKQFADQYLSDIFSNKQETFEMLPEHSIPTVLIESNSPEDIALAVNQLDSFVSNHPNKNDFLPQIILKDQMGAGGINIYKISNNFSKSISKIMNKHRNISFVIQPLVQFDDGFKFKNFDGLTEVRLIYHGKKIIQTYVRIAQKEGFICNEGLGGIAIDIHDIPKSILRKSKEIIASLPVNQNVFALDFIITNNKNVYLLEANISPGIDWHPEFPNNVMMNKKMIRIIVSELSKRVKKTNTSLPNPTILNKNTLSKIKPLSI